MQQRGIKNLIIMGVHTNMCVLGRSFAIKQMVKWGVNVVLVRDLTDAMYNPAKPPYVSHEEGTRLVVEYIEKFWCPSVLSEDLIR
jgi:nicotinamidase-related amidase